MTEKLKCKCDLFNALLTVRSWCSGTQIFIERQSSSSSLVGFHLNRPNGGVNRWTNNSHAHFTTRKLRKHLNFHQRYEQNWFAKERVFLLDIIIAIQKNTYSIEWRITCFWRSKSLKNVKIGGKSTLEYFEFIFPGFNL